MFLGRVELGIAGVGSGLKPGRDETNTYLHLFRSGLVSFLDRVDPGGIGPDTGQEWLKRIRPNGGIHRGESKIRSPLPSLSTREEKEKTWPLIYRSFSVA
jgi:hypothetical protein